MHTVADRVYADVRHWLMSQKLAPGERLNLDKIARDLHVSNTPVRHAIARLEFEGMVIRAQGRGYCASPLLDARAIGELYHYRLLIEPAAAATAARHRSPVLAMKLSELIDLVLRTDVPNLVADPIQAADVKERDFQFHLMVADGAGNRVLCDHLASALGSMIPFTLYDDAAAVTAAWNEHREVANAIAAADVDLARRTMTTHLTNSLARLQKAAGRAAARPDG